MKILTTQGYGLLSSEKSGPKNICHVGITNSLLSIMRFEAFKEFNNREFLDARRFCVNIFKRNEIDSQILVYPKTFLFDSSLLILDNDYNGNSLNHINNFVDNWTFDNIINNVEFTQVRTGNFSEGKDPFKNLTSSLDLRHVLGSVLINQDNVPKDLLINHIFDYAFKIYYRYSLGIDFNENTFTLNPIRKNSGVVSGGLSLSQNEIQNNYDNFINQVRLLYPAANVNQKLASELFRTIEIIAANPGYCLSDKFKKVIYPKKFDNVLSILVNEKDFILYTPAYDKEFLDVYKTEPKFSYTSKLSRPQTRPPLNTEIPTLLGQKSNPINRYSKECEENYPEIFSLYTTITILPEK
jgi:hypothetical protein